MDGYLRVGSRTRRYIISVPVAIAAAIGYLSVSGATMAGSYAMLIQR